MAQNSYVADAHVGAIEPAPLPYTDWDRLVAAREEVVVASIAEHRALTSVNIMRRTWAERCVNLNTLRASLYVLNQSRTALRRCQHIEPDAFLVWTGGIDGDIAAEQAYVDPDSAIEQAMAQAADERTTWDIAQREARGERFA